MTGDVPPAEAPMQSGGDGPLSTPVPAAPQTAEEFMRERVRALPVQKIYSNGDRQYDPQQLHDTVVQAGKDWTQRQDPVRRSEATYNDARTHQLLHPEPDTEEAVALKKAQAEEAAARAVWYHAEAGRINRGDTTPAAPLDPAAVEKIAGDRTDRMVPIITARYTTKSVGADGKEVETVDAEKVQKAVENYHVNQLRLLEAKHNPPPGASVTGGAPVPGGPPLNSGPPPAAPPPAVAQPAPVAAPPPAAAQPVAAPAPVEAPPPAAAPIATTTKAPSPLALKLADKWHPKR